jgi:peptidoglycan L-alanyl-D-glutamate endopeptidase CwlK
MSYSYGPKSQAVFDSLHPELQILFTWVILLKDVSLIEGHRPNARQAVLLAAGKTKVGPGKSKHNKIPSEAVDQIPYPFSQADWHDGFKFHLHAGFILGIAAILYEMKIMNRRIRWGGDWDKDWETSDNMFDDFPHIELI